MNLPGYISLEQGVVHAFPEAQIRLVTARGLRNDIQWTDLTDRLLRLEESLAAGSWEPFDENDPTIASWHEAYRRFGANPRRCRPSLDALSRRLRKTGRLRRINSAVDAYNFISVTFGVPAGAFDLAELGPSVMIRRSHAGDHFTPLGEPDVMEEPAPGEVVYADGRRVLTRQWNHRDADQTKVTEKTRNVLFIVERVAEAAVCSTRLAEAQAALAELVRPHAGTVQLGELSAESTVAGLTPDSEC
jgi:DNA/RNA-binding domain of Phe-tRNA-synthetase-like protein